MASFFYGFLAAVLAYGVNKLLVRLLTKEKVALVAPSIEECLKTFLGLLGQGNIVFTHFAFGFAEGLYDLITARQKYLAFFLSIVTHTVFGIITLSITEKFTLFLGISTAALGHTLYNLIVLKMARR
ncbi:hypothetical protein [Carboxydothermus ferrireducens]|uniref:Ca2+/Na+ antiporter n=1 Tax=Carboxydothermus ferrireducens DSM 11255 TaxID=1119529 RepID=A0ABX2R895_9THEO|nr:hypothetical protein [Carboxydothermus ferrireducens]NYE57391.1 Ca2+/Na+ antiporter [Carboxydothermus ferrireducens DSM 11255]